MRLFRMAISFEWTEEYDGRWLCRASDYPYAIGCVERQNNGIYEAIIGIHYHHPENPWYDDDDRIACLSRHTGIAFVEEGYSIIRGELPPPPENVFIESSSGKPQISPPIE